MKDEKIKARKLSYDSQMYLLMLGQFLHVFSLNELVDISKIYAKCFRAYAESHPLFRGALQAIATGSDICCARKKDDAA